MFELTNGTVRDFLLDLVVFLAEIITNRFFLIFFFFGVAAYVGYLLHMLAHKSDDVDDESLF